MNETDRYIFEIRAGIRPRVTPRQRRRKLVEPIKMPTPIPLKTRPKLATSLVDASELAQGYTFISTSLPDSEVAADSVPARGAV